MWNVLHRSPVLASSVRFIAFLWLILPLLELRGEDRFELVVRNQMELQRALANPQPGTSILLAPGRYRGGIRAAGLTGESERPIRIAGLDPDSPPIISGGTTGIHLVAPRHVELQHLIIEQAQANGLNIDDGGNPESPARHILLKDLQVRDVGPRGNRDGIKLSGVADFVVDGCVVERWGDGGSAIDMVGCHRGRIVHCTFREARGEMANGVQAKGGSEEITISRCRFENAGGRAVNLGGSTGLPYFRPKMQGFEARDIVVEDSYFLRSSAPFAFVGVDGAIVRHNLVYRPNRWVIRILQESQGPEFIPSRNGQFLNNIIVFRTDEIRSITNIGPGTAPETFRFADNVWYCLDRPEFTERIARELPAEELNPRYQDPLLVDAEGGDFDLSPQSPAGDAGVRDASPIEIP
jgi:hypothetical protein